MTEDQFPKEVPQVTFKTRVRDESIGGDNPFKWQDTTTEEIFKGKKIVLFSLPGAFTPICSNDQLPGYENNVDEFKKLGVDDVICLAVNDAFVMYNWGKAQGIKNVKLLPDGSGKFTEAMGMLVQKNNVGYGKRSWRYSMFVDDGEIKKAFIEPGFSDDCPDDPFEVSNAENMLEWLKENQ